MGDQASCTVRAGGAVSEGTAHLESEALVFRGTFRLAIRFSEVSSAAVTPTPAGDELALTFPGGTATFAGLGTKARRWAEAIRHPKAVIDKLGVKPGMRVALVNLEGDAFADFAAQLDRRGAAVTRGTPRAGTRALDLVFLSVAHPADLRRIATLRRRLHPAGALWVLRPKGSPDLGEVEVLDAGRAAGLVDTKVVAFSPAVSAARFVIPVAERVAAGR